MKYVIVSDYSGEQGHLPRAEGYVHGKYKTYDEAKAALETKIKSHEMDYRDYRIEVWE